MPLTVYCPYYKYDQEACIRCEAGLLDFRSKYQKADYINQYCADLPNYKRCTLAHSLEIHYDRTLHIKQEKKQ